MSAQIMMVDFEEVEVVVAAVEEEVEAEEVCFS